MAMSLFGDKVEMTRSSEATESLKLRCCTVVPAMTRSGWFLPSREVLILLRTPTTGTETMATIIFMAQQHKIISMATCLMQIIPQLKRQISLVAMISSEVTEAMT